MQQRHPIAASGQTPPSRTVSVRKRNLDANGNIKVHEQGVANVNGVVTTQGAQLRCCPDTPLQEKRRQGIDHVGQHLPQHVDIMIELVES